MIERTEGYFTGELNFELFYQTWKQPDAKGTLLITHGLSEHSECYDRLAQGIESYGYNIYAWDLRGHGRSEGKRGLALDFLDYCRDLKTFYRLVREKSGGPLVMLGHSMGGLITTRALMESSDLKPAAVCLSAPAFGLAMPVPWIKDRASRLIAKFSPRLTLANDINYAQLSQEPKILASYEKDTLRHARISAGVYLGILENSDFVLKNQDLFKHSLFMQLPENDPVCNTTTAIEFFEQLEVEQKKKIVYSNSRHEIYNDIEREQAFQDLGEFLNSTNA